MRNSSLRGFSASARNYLTVLLNLIRGNPDVLVKRPGFFWQQGTRGQFSTHWKVYVQSLSPYRCLLGQSGDMKWKLCLLTEALIGSSAVKRCCVCGDAMHSTYFLKEAKEQKGHKGYRHTIVEKHNKTQRNIKLARLFICLAELCFRRLLEGWRSVLLQQNPCKNVIF